MLSAKKFDFEYESLIRSDSLKKLSIQENLTNSDSGNFTVFKDNNDYMMAYVDKGINVNIYNIFNKSEKVIDKFHNNGKTIVCLNCFAFKEKQYLAIIALNNTMSIYDLTTDKIIRRVEKISDKFYEKNDLQIFSLSSVNNTAKIDD